MKYTNKLNLSQPLFDAIVAENEKEHTPADYSVTQLLKGAAEIALTKLHEDELVVDVSDLINPLFGSAVHSILEKAGNQETSEVYMEADVIGKKVSGTIDLAGDIVTTDYKTCASWKITYEDFEDWRNQLKGYNYLRFINTGKMILIGRIEALIKDWSPSKAETDRNYPQSPVFKIQFTFTEEEILSVPIEWSKKIEDVELLIDGKAEFYPCSDEERWHEPDKWALMKPRRKTAVKLYDSEADATAACTDKNLYIELRPGKDKKCDRYCIVGRCGFCPYYNETHKEDNENG